MSEPQQVIEERRRMRRIVRKASLYTYGFLGAAFGVAIGGAAVLAWLLTFGGLPFLDTWIAISIIVLVPSLLGLVWRALRDGSDRPVPDSSSDLAAGAGASADNSRRDD